MVYRSPGTRIGTGRIRCSATIPGGSTALTRQILSRLAISAASVLAGMGSTRLSLLAGIGGFTGDTVVQQGAPHGELVDHLVAGIPQAEPFVQGVIEEATDPGSL